MAGHFYYGDNLAVMREHIADNSVGLIYLDPPFKSDATYNMLFSGPDGGAPAESQVRLLKILGSGALKLGGSLTKFASKRPMLAPSYRRCGQSWANAGCWPTYRG